MTELGLTHGAGVNTPLPPDFWEEQSNRQMAEDPPKHLRYPRDISHPPQQSRVLHPPLFHSSPYSPMAAGPPALSCRPLAPGLHTSSFFDLLHTELGSGGCCRVMLRGRISKHELAAPQDRAHTVLRCFPHLGEGEPRWVEAMDPGGTASPRNEPQRQHHPSPGAPGAHLGLGMNAEAQQAMIDLEGDRVAPGCQVLLPQQRGQAREYLRQGSSRGVSITPQRHLLIVMASGRAPSTTLQQQPRPRLSADPRAELAQLAASWLLTHRRAEVELLQACEDTIPMKAFEASENFFMSTGLGTLPGEGGASAVREAGSR